MPNHHHLKIYQSRRHLVITLLFIIVPFVFLLLFSRLAQISISRLLDDLGLSFYRMLIAYVLAAVIGWLLAVSFYTGRRAVVGLPLFDVLQSFPTFAALPLAAYVWGPTNFTVIVFLIITIIWPIFFSIISSLKLIRHDWQEVTQVFGLRGWAYLRYFLIPVSLPGLITGSVVGLGEGWEALVATEMIAGLPAGLGEFFQSYAHNALFTGVGIFGLLIFIFSLNKLVWLQLLNWGHKQMED